LLRSGVVSDGLQRRNAGLLRVGVVDAAAEAFAAEDDDEAVFLHVADKDFDAGNLDLIELLAERCGAVRIDAASTAVGDFAGGIERAEVAADGDVEITDRRA